MLNVIHKALSRHSVTSQQLLPIPERQDDEGRGGDLGAFTTIKFKGSIDGTEYVIGKVFDTWKIVVNEGRKKSYAAALVAPSIAS